MRLPLRLRILLFTVLPSATLTLGALWMVHRSVVAQARRGAEDDLRRSSAAFETLLEARARELSIEGQVIAQDPKFFSVLTLPGGARDPLVRETVAGVARDFNAIVGSDVFEVLDAAGRPLASVGRQPLDAALREGLVAPALDGRPGAVVRVAEGAHLQLAATPVHAGGRVVGVLLLGHRLGPEMAARLKAQARGDVSFVADRALLTSTLEDPDARLALSRAVRDVAAAPGRGGAMLEVEGGGDRRLTLVRPLPLASADGRQLYVLQRALGAETAYLGGIQSGLLQLGLVAVAVSLAAGWLVAERILSPVRRLVRGAEEMQRGNYAWPLDVRAGDEIGYLAQRFGEMRERQREYVRALEEVARVKSEFISVASHELRTPISIIRGFQELLASGAMGPLSASQREALQAIARSTGTLERIAEDATRMAQLEGRGVELHRALHDADALLQRALETARAAAPGRAVDLGLSVDPDVGAVRVDGPRLVIAVVHLLTNGIRFTPDGGRVAVRAWREGDALAVSVSDTGVGIPPERARHLFERASPLRDSLHHHSSSTLEFNSAGLGLGLAIARGIVDAHGGRLEVESAPGRGSTFTFRVPAACAGEVAA